MSRICKVRSTKNAFGVIFLLSISLCVRTADSEAELDREIERIRETVAQEQVEWEELQQREEQLQNDLRASSQKLSEHEQALARQTREIQSLDRDIEYLTMQLESLSESEQRLQERYAERVRLAYMTKEESIASVVLQVKDSRERARLQLYLNRLQDADIALQKELKESTERVLKAQQQRELLHRERTTARRELENKQALAKKEIARIAELQAGLVKRKNAKEEKMLELESQALRMEAILASMTGSGGASLDVTRAPLKLEETTEAPSEEQSSYDGTGLKNATTALALPLAQLVLTSEFGQQKVSGFREQIMKKGVSMRAPSGSNLQVRSVMEGRVVFLGEIPGVGLSCIIDHGKRYYSLYGLLDSASVSLHQEVSREQPLGMVNSKEPILYFEIRHQGKSLNPERFFEKSFPR